MPPTLPKYISDHPWWAWLFLGPGALAFGILIAGAIVVCYLVASIFSLLALAVRFIMNPRGVIAPGPEKSSSEGQDGPESGKNSGMIGM